MSRTGLPPPLLNRAYHIWMSSTGARPLSSAIDRGAGAGSVFHFSVSVVTEGKAPTRTMMTAAVATISTIQPRNGEVVFAACAMATIPIAAAHAVYATARVRNAAQAQPMQLDYYTPIADPGGALHERSWHRSSQVSRGRCTWSDHNGCDRRARSARADRRPQFVGHRSAKAESAGEHLRLSHAHLRPGAVSDAAESKDCTEQRSRSAVSAASATDRDDACHRRAAAELCDRQSRHARCA